MIHFKEIEIACAQKVDFRYISEYLTARFQTCWTEPPLGVDPVSGYVQNGPERTYFRL